MKIIDEIKTVDEAASEAIRECESRKQAIGFMCLWECNNLGLMPIRKEESCFGASVEHLLRRWGKKEASDCCGYSSLVNRLRGIYTIPVDDGAGQLNRSDTFTRKFDGLPPINGEAANAIEYLLEALRDMTEIMAGTDDARLDAMHSGYNVMSEFAFSKVVETK